MPPDTRESQAHQPGSPSAHDGGGDHQDLTIPELTDQNRRAALHAIRQRPHIETAQRRERVLRHRDLAEQLTRPPLGYKRADQWGGFVPPALLAEDAECIVACGRNRCQHEHGAWRIDSPRRAALVELNAEAWRREHERIAS
jgi:hypothetical protein